ncbi:hypothetical protein SteCoe_18435 [Stentor coeruleus]|uniref:Uncharacterized protein n=1 Tax=Stentor coeruleus TaxID=5963 RepID=A0A1R2BWZ7_9CILI|nr:hypothetical protein SteCoe_18435 [Stentor coeruleus]
MEAKGLSYLMNKYSRTQKVNQIEELPSNPSPKALFIPNRETSSKAYAAAMRALHERIRYLEKENSELLNRLKITELKLYESTENTKNPRLIPEDPDYKNQLLLESLNDLKQELLSTKQENSMLQSQLKGTQSSEILQLTKEYAYIKEKLAEAKLENQQLKNHIEDLESKELPQVHKENLLLKQELDYIYRNTSETKSHDITQKMQIQKLLEEKDLLQNELIKEKHKSFSSFHDFSDLKPISNINSKENSRIQVVKQNFMQASNSVDRPYEENRVGFESQDYNDIYRNSEKKGKTSPGLEKNRENVSRNSKFKKSSTSPKRKKSSRNLSPGVKKRVLRGRLEKTAKEREEPFNKTSTQKSVSFKDIKKPKSRSKSKSLSPTNLTYKTRRSDANE